MPELAPSLTPMGRGLRRVEVIASLSAQVARLQSQLRMQTAVLASEDTPFGQRAYLCDELALALNESPGTAQRLIEIAQMYVAHPVVMAKVGLALEDGGWSQRHADALLLSIAGLGLCERVQQQVVDLVSSHPDARTPHQIRKAAQAAVMVLDPEGAERRLAKARKDRHVGAEASSSGVGYFWATGTASQMAMVMASIDCLAGPKQPGDDRTLDQRRFDAFMDLICGRIQPGQWQAVVVVALDTLTGESQEPAEIPGLGLISAGEARDLFPHADLRRAVVDDHGQVVSIDSHVHHPDLPDPVRLDEPRPDHGLSLQTEPEPLDTTPEESPADADVTWVLEQQHVDEQVQTAASTLEAELTALLAAHVPARLTLVGAGEDHWPWMRLEIDGRGHDPRAGGGAGPGGPPEVPPEPEPPSLDDELWAEATLDREAQDALEPPPRYQREPWTPYPRHTQAGPRWTSWTRLALTAALTQVATSKVDPRPLSSTAYALPSRLARFIKHRDITCSFPGCTGWRGTARTTTYCPGR